MVIRERLSADNRCPIFPIRWWRV